MKCLPLLIIILMVICSTTIILYADVGPENIDKNAVSRTSAPAVSASAPSSHLPDIIPKQLSSALYASRTAPPQVPTKSSKAEAPVAAPFAKLPNFIEPITGMEFLPVSGGCFQMGESNGDADEKPVHPVCLDSFYIGKFEVTQGQWQQMMGSRPSFFSSCGDNCPVESVSWNDAQEFIRKLNSLNGKTYRLLTEAEWESACRGGKTVRFCGSNDVDDVAWYDKNSNSKPHPVGEKRPNGLGIYDMSGNVWEWVNDWFHKDSYSSSPPRNPEGALSGSKRVIRGGSWYNDSSNVRTSIRGSDDPDHRSINLGFRLAYSAR